jgi:hypothetical protein
VLGVRVLGVRMLGVRMLGVRVLGWMSRFFIAYSSLETWKANVIKICKIEQIKVIICLGAAFQCLND